jgi:hypothetical protein
MHLSLQVELDKLRPGHVSIPKSLEPTQASCWHRGFLLPGPPTGTLRHMSWTWIVSNKRTVSEPYAVEGLITYRVSGNGNAWLGLSHKADSRRSLLRY